MCYFQALLGLVFLDAASYVSTLLSLVLCELIDFEAHHSLHDVS